VNRALPAAEFLFDMRLSKRRESALPDHIVPQSLDEAYLAQNHLVSRMLAHIGGQPIGYKVAATNATAQRLLGVDSPFFGVLLSASSHPGPVTLESENFTVRCVEAEFAFEVGEDVPTTSTAYTAETIVPFLASAFPSIEIVDHRYHDWKTVGAFSLIADNAIHGAWVSGDPCPDWRTLDFVSHPVTVFVNGVSHATGSGAAVLGNPLNAVAWLANELPRHGRQLRRGDHISTGTAADVYLAAPGDRVAADFGKLGRVEVMFTP